MPTVHPVRTLIDFNAHMAPGNSHPTDILLLTAIDGLELLFLIVHWLVRKHLALRLPLCIPKVDVVFPIESIFRREEYALEYFFVDLDEVVVSGKAQRTVRDTASRGWGRRDGSRLL